MHILGGDLAPARRRQYGGGYGRRRRRRTWRVIVAALLLLGAAGVASFLLQDTAEAPTRVAQKPCPTVSPASVVALPGPPQVRLTLLNGTPRNGLAKAMGNRLVAQGFVVLSQGNAPAALSGPSRVTFGPGAEPAATVLSHWVRGSTVAAAPRAPAGSVSVTLGSTFTRLSTPAEVAAIELAAAGPAPTAAAC